MRNETLLWSGNIPVGPTKVHVSKIPDRIIQLTWFCICFLNNEVLHLFKKQICFAFHFSKKKPKERVESSGSYSSVFILTQSADLGRVHPVRNVLMSWCDTIPLPCYEQKKTPGGSGSSTMLSASRRNDASPSGLARPFFFFPTVLFFLRWADVYCSKRSATWESDITHISHGLLHLCKYTCLIWRPSWRTPQPFSDVFGSILVQAEKLNGGEMKKMVALFVL